MLHFNYHQNMQINLLNMKRTFKKNIIDLIRTKILNWENINDFLIGNGPKNKPGNPQCKTKETHF